AIAATVAAVDHHLGPVGDQPSDVLVLPGVGPTGSDWFDDDDDDGFEAAWTAHEANVALFVRTSLAEHQGAPAPAGVAEVAATIRQGVRDRMWPHSTLADSSPPTAAVLDDTTDSDVVLWAVSAIVDPDPDLDQVEEEELTDDSHPRASVGALDSVDWATVIVEVVRAGPGMFCGAEQLTEILLATTEGGEDDGDVIEAVFEGNRLLWRAAGVTDAGDRLTEVGVWALPRAICRALGTEFD
ncbi:MAG: hypothetical protein GY929_14395, partial [Actinomycetia bacterium]|nr:hypothetical protein [Actinomycetes bacterium]